MSSSWANKLEIRLSALADSASKESIQTLAKWMGFNRKYGAAFASTLAAALLEAGAARQWLYLQVAHEALMVNLDNNQKWERSADLRTIIGELVIIPAVEVLKPGEAKERINDLVKEWDDNNVFGGPTLIAQIRKTLLTLTKVTPPSVPVPQVTSLPVAVKAETKKPFAETSVVVTPKDDFETGRKVSGESSIEVKSGGGNDSFKEEELEEAKTEGLMTTKQYKSEEPQTLSTPAAQTQKLSPAEEVTFDFKSEGIALGKVDAREFLEPCKAIATLQIARELRSDTAVQLSSQFDALPENVQKICEEAKQQQDSTGKAPKITKEEAEALSLSISDEMLDLDVDEALQNVRTFREIVEKQHIARKQLIYLLIKSRCQFGSEKAAGAFHKLADDAKLLQKRKEILSDAMALEGLDFEEQEGQVSKGSGDDGLPPLTWYQPPSEPDTKRAKMQ